MRMAFFPFHGLSSHNAFRYFGVRASVSLPYRSGRCRSSLATGCNDSHSPSVFGVRFLTLCSINKRQGGLPMLRSAFRLYYTVVWEMIYEGDVLPGECSSSRGGMPPAECSMPEDGMLLEDGRQY